jgi:hypothetical protein
MKGIQTRDLKAEMLCRIENSRKVSRNFGNLMEDFLATMFFS